MTTTIPTSGRVGRAPRTATAPPVLGVPSAPPLPEELELLLRGLRLPHIRRHAPEVLATAKAQRWEPAEVLKALLTEEAAGRARSALATRRAAAAFPTGKTFDAWQPQVSSVPLPTQQALQTLEWIGRRENLVICGPSGTGKTFLLEALGQQAVEQGLKVAWFTLEQLGVLVGRHRADDSVSKAIARVLRADLVVVDDIGLLACGPGRRRGPLPTGRRCLRETQRCDQLEPAPSRVRRADAEDTCDGHGRQVAPSRACLPDHRRQRPTHPGPRREGSPFADLSTTGDGQHLGRSHGRHRAVLVAASGHFS